MKYRLNFYSPAGLILIFYQRNTKKTLHRKMLDLKKNYHLQLFSLQHYITFFCGLWTIELYNFSVVCRLWTNIELQLYSTNPSVDYKSWLRYTILFSDLSSTRALSSEQSEHIETPDITVASIRFATQPT